MNAYYHLDKNFFPTPVIYGNIQLHQIGRLYCTPDAVVPEHQHLEWFELTVVTKGTGITFTNKQSVPIQKDDIYLSLPGDIHKIKSSLNEPLHYDYFAFNTENIAFKKELNAIAIHFSAPDKRIFHNENIASLISLGIAEINSNQKFGKDLLNNIFQQILIYTIRGFHPDEISEISQTSSQSDILCFQIMNYIDTHLYTMEKLQDLVTITNYNYSYLSNLFKKTTHTTIQQYYQMKKMATAQRLLVENMSVTQISTLLNYSSPFAFSKAFKDYFKLSPRDYVYSLKLPTT